MCQNRENSLPTAVLNNWVFVLKKASLPKTAWASRIWSTCCLLPLAWVPPPHREKAVVLFHHVVSIPPVLSVPSGGLAAAPWKRCSEVTRRMFKFLNSCQCLLNPCRACLMFNWSLGENCMVSALLGVGVGGPTIGRSFFISFPTALFCFGKIFCNPLTHLLATWGSTPDRYELQSFCFYLRKLGN